MLTRQQLYKLYHAGVDVMLHFVEQILSHLADVERHVGHRQQYTIDDLGQRLARLTTRVERLKAQLLQQQMLNYQLTRRVQQLQTELARRASESGQAAPHALRRDSHNAGQPPSLDLPGAKAANAVRRTRSLRRKSGKRIGGQVGHQGCDALGKLSILTACKFIRRAYVIAAMLH